MNILLSKLRLVFEIIPKADLESFAQRFFQDIKGVSIQAYPPNEWNQSRALVFTYAFQDYREVVTTLFQKLANGQEELERNGLLELLEVDFYGQHEGAIHFEFTAKHLQLLQQIQPDGTGISINTELGKTWSIAEEEEDLEYHQVYFNAKQELQEPIKSLWENYFPAKYEPFLQWNNPNNKEPLILTIQESLEDYEWEELFEDLLGFIKREQAYFQEEEVTLEYRILCKNQLCTELGTTFILAVLATGVDLMLVMEQDVYES